MRASPVAQRHFRFRQQVVKRSSRNSISQREWIAVSAIAAFALGLTLVLHLLQAQLGPVDRIQVGTFWFWRDFGQYLAAIREGAASASWLIHNHFSAEPHEPVFMYPLYVAIGKLAAATGAPLMAVYRAAEIGTRLLIPVSLYAFVATFIGPLQLRRLALVLALFGGGIGFWLVLVMLLLGQGDPSALGLRPLNPDLEAMTFGSLLAAPHLGLGLAATLLAAAFFCRAVAGSRWNVIALALAAAVLSLVNPFNLPPLLLAMVVHAGVCLWRAPDLAGKAALAAGAACAAAAPALVYSFVIFNFAPFWSETYRAQNVLPSPAPWNLLGDYGIVLPLAVVGAWALRSSSTGSQRFLLLWVAIIVVAMYAPVPYQRRFAFGLHPALVVLGVVGWPTWQSWVLRVIGGWRLPPPARTFMGRRLAIYPLLLLGFADVLMAYAALCLSVVTNRPLPVYTVDRDTYSAGQWLAQQSGPEDVVLASFTTGNVLGGMVPGRVVAGYEVATLNATEKRAAIDALYRGELSGDRLRSFLAANRVSYVLVGSEERKLGLYDPGADLGLPVATRSGSTVLYRVTGPGRYSVAPVPPE